MAALPPLQRPIGKKFVIACDGTWQNSDGSDSSEPSNVVRITRALKHFDDNGVPQLAYYQRGAGTDSSVEDRVLGGFTGSDIAEHIREAYGLLANNFNPETQKELKDGTGPIDDIVLLGFSRGAFTARAIASLISDVGILTKIGMEYFWGIFDDWKSQATPNHKSRWFQSKYPNASPNIAFTDPEYRETLMKDGLTRWGMKIRAVGVWDTVGALGIPVDWNKKDVKEFSFVNTKVARHVRYAFHALGLDEHRRLFGPTMWELPDDTHNLKKLKQCWFPGVHSNIGGSYPDSGISNITLAWMISQLEDHDGGILSFDPNYLDQVQDWNIAGYAKRKEKVRPWGMGRIYDSASPNNVLTAAQGLNPVTRIPGRYCQIDLHSGLQNNIPLTNTNEYLHRSVRVRINGGGLGTEDDPANTTSMFINMGKKLFTHDAQSAATPQPYASAALSGYDMEQSATIQAEVDHSQPGPSGVYWVTKEGHKLPEDELGRTEIRMLQRSITIGQAAGNGH